MFTNHVYYFENITAFDKILLSKEIKKNNGRITHFAKDTKITHVIVENVPENGSEKIYVSVRDIKRQLSENTESAPESTETAAEPAPESTEIAAVYESESIEAELQNEAEQKKNKKEEKKRQKKIEAENRKQRKKSQIIKKRQENAESEAQKFQAIREERERLIREEKARKQEIRRLKDEATWVTPNKTFVEAVLAPAPVPVNTLELGKKLFVGKIKLDDINNPTFITLRKSSMEYIFMTFGPATFRHNWEKNYFFVIYEKKEDAEKAFASLSIYENRVKFVNRFKHDNVSAPKPNFYVRWPQS